ncbi:ATP-grasp domain-containing protein [Granulosicoccus sp.]|nr:ATP-grasp domain-containing protein [Granulosicoccus sp.]MDB4223371.1 ATP-grasp domain-containing protein [Granulosicoccus sp.]
MNIIFIGQRSFDGLSAALVSDVSVIVSCDQLQCDSLLGLKLEIRSLESEGCSRSPWTSSDIDLLSDILIEKVSLGEDNILLPYSSSSSMDDIGEKFKLDVLSPAFELQRSLDNKINNTKLFSSLGLPTTERIYATPSESEYFYLRKLLGCSFVARAPYGSTGSTVHLIRNNLDMQRLVPYESVWMFERYIEGISINVNAVVFENSTVTYEPSIQISGISDLSDRPFGFCGNDFTAARNINKRMLAECRRQTVSIGESMASLSYRGIMGVDFIIADDHEVYPLEVNPRFQNSTALLNIMYKNQPDISPTQLHIQSYEKCSSPSKKISADCDLNQLIVNAPTQYSDYIVVKSVVDGVYSLATLDCSSPGLVFPNTLDDDSFIVVGAPMSGSTIRADSMMFKMLSRSALLNQDEQTIKAGWRSVIKKIKQRFDLRSFEHDEE